jgi:hypothetical protein
VGGALLLLLSKADMSLATEPQKAEIIYTDKLLTSLKQPLLQEQQTFLVNLLVSNPTPQQFEHMIVSCDAYGAKKTQRFVVQLHINRNTPLTHIYMYVKWAMGTLGGALQCGQGPRGEAVRQVTGA